MAETTTPLQTPTTGQIAKVTFASALGGFIEYFQLFIASIIGATVWPKIFFTGGIATTVGFSIASVGVAYVMRPVGGFFFGRIGDRVGRKNTLVLTLILMGIGTFAIGFVPDYAAIGLAAPIILFVCRGVYGLGLGGEYGGGVSWILEFAAKSKWRSFWSVWAAPANIALAVAASSTAALEASMSTAAFDSTGWRILFLLSGVIIVIAFVVRYRLAESPLFKQIKDRNDVAKRPASEAIRKYWKQIIALAIIGGSIQGGVTTSLLTPFSLSYLGAQGLSPAFGASMLSLSNAIGIIAFVAGPWFSEKLGRKLHLLISIIWAIIGVALFLPLVGTGLVSMIALAYIIPEVQVGFNNSAVQAISGETFPIRYRYSGAGFSYQLGNGFVAGMIVAFVIPFLLKSFGIKGTAPYIVGILIVWQLIAMACLLLLKETKKADLSL
jgi:MFS family permease